MSILNVIFIYILVWWLMLFTVLPLGVERHQDEGKGHDAGAPQRANMKKKFLINSVLSAIIVAIIYVLADKGIISMDMLYGVNKK